MLLCVPQIVGAEFHIKSVIEVHALSFIVPPEVNLVSNHARLSANGPPTILTCNAIGVSLENITYSWTYEGTPLLNETNRTITLLSVEGAGVYTCEVMGRFGIGKDSINMTIGKVCPNGCDYQGLTWLTTKMCYLL